MKKILLLLFFVLFPLTAHAGDKALDRINKSGEINCGVYVLNSIFSYGLKGEPQGFTADLMDEISLRTGLKVRYTEIASFATLKEDLDGGKYDMICSLLLFFPSSSMKMLPGRFISFDEINVYTDGQRNLSEIKSIQDLNDPRYTFVGMDGELGGIYVPKLLPKAKLNLLSFGTPPSHMFLELQTKKADFIVLSRLAAQAYLKDNPGKLKQAFHMPLTKASVRLFFPAESNVLKANMDAVTEELQKDGTMELLLKKHGIQFE